MEAIKLLNTVLELFLPQYYNDNSCHLHFELEDNFLDFFFEF